jgi:hypothetical protein
MFNEIFDVKHYAPANVDSSPHQDARALAEAIGEEDGQQFVRSFMDGVPREARAGEFKAYSTEDGVRVKADVYIKRNGAVEIEGSRKKENGQDTGLKAILCVKEDGTIELNGATYVGLVKIVELTAKLNLLVAEVRAHHHGGAAPATTFSDFVKEDYENTTVNHGGGI